MIVNEVGPYRFSPRCTCGHADYSHFGPGCKRCRCKGLVYDCRPPTPDAERVALYGDEASGYWIVTVRHVKGEEIIAGYGPLRTASEQARWALYARGHPVIAGSRRRTPAARPSPGGAVA